MKKILIILLALCMVSLCVGCGNTNFTDIIGDKNQKETVEDVEDEEEIESAITALNNYWAEMNYLTKLFYTVKGTKKVIEFAKKFIPSLSQAEITYSPDELKININQLAENIDENLYSQYIEGFFNALLIFKRFTCNINQANIVIDASLSSAVGVGVQAFQIIRG